MSEIYRDLYKNALNRAIQEGDEDVVDVLLKHVFVGSDTLRFAIDQDPSDKSKKILLSVIKEIEEIEKDEEEYWPNDIILFIKNFKSGKKCIEEILNDYHEGDYG